MGLDHRDGWPLSQIETPDALEAQRNFSRFMRLYVEEVRMALEIRPRSRAPWLQPGYRGPKITCCLCAGRKAGSRDPHIQAFRDAGLDPDGLCRAHAEELSTRVADREIFGRVLLRELLLEPGYPLRPSHLP